MIRNIKKDLNLKKRERSIFYKKILKSYKKVINLIIYRLDYLKLLKKSEISITNLNY
jgi:hypothetical protein